MRYRTYARCAGILAAISLFGPPAFAEGFERGREAYQDERYAAAYESWKPLAERGHAQAQARLGELYRNGLGVERDAVRAAQWFERAAGQGVHAAQYLLGLLYSEGDGVPQDDVLAYKWLHLAVAGTDLAASVNASRARQRLVQRMSREQVAEAERLAREQVRQR